MNVNILYLLLIITLFNVCASRKSGLYPGQDNDNNAYEEGGNNVEYQYQNYENYDPYVEQNQQNRKKSALNTNQEQYQDQNQEQSQNSNSDTNSQNNEIKTRHLYKYSFKKPYYYYNDTNVIPNWEHHGDVIPALDMIRLVPSVPNKMGSIWSKLQNKYDEWQAIISFRINGRGVTGSDGLALFYTDKQLNTDTFYGSEHKWNGLAIIFDTANVDNKSHIPTINVLYNDGNTLIQSQKNYNDIRKGVCVADFRNSPNPVYARITYSNRMLKIEVDLSHEGKQYYECSNEKIELPKDYYFGISAKTGNSNPDDHDILSFDFYQLNPPIKENHRLRPKEEEIIEEEGEYQMDAEMLKRIQRVKDEVGKQDEEKQKQDDLEKNINARSVQLTQFRILETVNRILQYVQNNNSGNGDSIQNETIEEINNRSNQLISDVSETYDRVEALNQKIEYLNDSVERDSQKNEYKINSLETRVNKKIGTEMDKVLNELRYIREENEMLREAIAREAKSKPNTWLVVFVSFFLNMLGIYIITRVLPSRSGSVDLFKTHNY